MAKNRLVRAGRSLALLGMTALVLPLALTAQDSTPPYPRRLSYFPYVTASPNDGVMAMARAVWFRQSRWDDRVSVHDQVAVEGGYSTKDSWLLRARGDFPRLADGWRLQVIVQAGKEGMYGGDTPAMRQVASVEVTRRIQGPVSVALRGDATHVIVGGSSATSESEVRGRLALVIDLRDREYDTRRGALLQFGPFIGSMNSMLGAYALASGWASMGERTRVTARAGIRTGSHLTTNGVRTLPAWEDDFVLGGGPESNRALPIGARVNKNMMLFAAEIRHDLKVFPGGAIAVLAFVDASRAYCDCAYLADTPGIAAPMEWTVGPGVGVALRLLRNSVLTATVARGEHATRLYISSGWSW